MRGRGGGCRKTLPSKKWNRLPRRMTNSRTLCQPADEREDATPPAAHHTAQARVAPGVQQFFIMWNLLGLSMLAALQPAFFDTAGRLQRGLMPATSSTANAPKRYYTPVHDGKSLLTQDDSGTWRPALLTATQLQDAGACLEVYLGQVDEDGSKSLLPGEYWLLDVSEQDTAPPLASDAGAQWMPLRARAGLSVCDSLASDEAALLATARGLAHWHRSIRFCSTCGSPAVELYRDGKGRRCNACGTRFRPRLDASVIVLVVDKANKRCLLGRKKEWPSGRYSTLAGFVEFGETLEECVVREVNEEAGVAVDRSSLRFVASQPWLFPRSLMVGFIAEAMDVDAVVSVDENELEDAAWFDKEFVRDALEQEKAGVENVDFHVPSHVSLARSLVDSWLSEA